MQRDIMAGKQSEIDGLVYEVVRMGEEYHVPVPAYKKVAESLRNSGKKIIERKWDGVQINTRNRKHYF